MKILHVIDSGGLYGAEVMLLNLVGEQLKIGLAPTIASIGEEGIETKELEEEGVRRGYDIRKFRMKPGPSLRGIMKVLKFARENHFDLLHSHGYKGNILLGFMPKGIRKIPLVSTLHGWTSTTGLTKMHIYEWLDVRSLRHIDAVVLVNKKMMSSPKLRNRKGINYIVINNGIPSADSNPRSDFPDLSLSPNSNLDGSILSFCQEGFTIGTIGRLSKEKGYTYLIDALHLLMRDNMDARLVIIGEGGERASLEVQIARRGLNDRVLLAGYQEDAKQYIPYFKIYAIPSLTEGLPITLLEAMQAKVPVVASEVGGIPEVLLNGQAGLLVRPGEPDHLAEAISIIYHNSIVTEDGRHADEMTEVAYHRVTNHYGSKAMARGYLDLYRQVLAAWKTA